METKIRRSIRDPFFKGYHGWTDLAAGTWSDEDCKTLLSFFKLDKVEINNKVQKIDRWSILSMSLFLDTDFHMFKVEDKQEGIEAGGKGVDTFTFAVTLTVSHDVCGLK